MLTFWIFHESNISVMISHFSKNDIYGSTIVEITGRRTWKQNWKQPFDCKLVYILGKTVGSGQIPSANSWWRRFEVFNIIFEIKRHIFLMFLLLTLNIVFLAGYVVCKVTLLFLQDWKKLTFTNWNVLLNNNKLL